MNELDFTEDYMAGRFIGTLEIIVILIFQDEKLKSLEHILNQRSSGKNIIEKGSSSDE